MGIPKLKRPHEDNDVYLHEKEIHVEERERGQDSPSSVESPMDGGTMGGTTVVPETPCTPGKPCVHDNAPGIPCLYDSDMKTKVMADVVPVPPSKPKRRKICGLRRRNFWILFAVIFAMIVAAAIIGGAIAGTRKTASSSTEPDTTPASPAASSTPVPSKGSPLL